MLPTMRLAPIPLALLLLPALLVVPGCDRREPEPVPEPPPAAPVSIWSASDAQAVATQLVEAATRDAWTSQFRDRNGRAATTRVGEIIDRSGHGVDIDALSAAITQALTSTGGDKLAAGNETADYVIGGVVGSSSGTDEQGKPVTFFAIDLSFSDAKTGDKVWPFSVERPVSGP